MIRVLTNSGINSVSVDKFPAGELKVVVDGINPLAKIANQVIIIQATLCSSDDIMTLLLTADIVKRNSFNCRLVLHIPYIAYARQDRVCNVGEGLSVAVMAQLINSIGADNVLISDPHSDVTTALINNCTVEDQVEIFGKLRADWQHIYIVAPDAGAAKKAHRFAEAVGAAGVIQCMKKRDLATGKLGGFVCLDDVESKHLFILDDICDGGGTFLGLSKILRPTASKLELAVTHGIFSKGIKVVADAFDHVYTTNSFHGELIKHVGVTCIDVFGN